MLRRSIYALLVSLSCIVSVTNVAVAREGAPDLDANATVQAHAVRYYTMKYDVSKEEAIRRLELQDAVMPSMFKLQATLGSRYGGAWFDAGDAGRLKIAVVDRDSADSRSAIDKTKDLLRSGGALAESDFVDAATSYNDLVSASHVIVKDLGPDALSVAVGVDVKTNSIRVTGSSLESSEKWQARMQQARSATDVPVQKKLVEGEFRPEKNCASGAPFCDRPLRGGVELGDSRVCTAGFNVTSRSDGKRYVLTAGHCKFNGSWYTKPSLYGAWNEIGPEHNMQFWYTGRDAGIIRNKVPSYWQQAPFPGPTIWVDDIPGVVPANNSYYIGQEGPAIVGSIVCVTGGGGRDAYPNSHLRRMFWQGTQWQSYTWCGGVTVASETISYSYDPAQTVYNLARTDLCTLGGMSGGPFFYSNIAYGILSGGACSGPNPLAQTWFYPAWLAENDLNVDIVH